MKTLVSLHDVSPRHEVAISRILDFLEKRGVPPVPLLVVPNFHGAWSLDAHPGFVERLHRWHARGHELVLHGYWHREKDDERRVSDLGDALKRSFLTGGEGEFLSLDGHDAGRRIDAGLTMWERAGLPGRPTGFVPPAWLHNSALDAELWKRNFLWTENHHGIRLSDGRRIQSPVISWASRDAFRRIASRLVCPSLERLWHGRETLRIALHPHDFDWPTLIGSIDRVLAKAARRGSWSVPRDLSPRAS